MTGGALLSIVLAGTAPVGAPLTFVPRVETVAAQVTLGEVADLSVLPPSLRGPAAQAVVAAFRPGQRHQTLRINDIAERVRAQVPSLVSWLNTPTSATITLDRADTTSPSRQAERPTCRRLLTALNRGVAPTAADFEPATCEATSVAFHYDAAAGVARAARDLGVGEIVIAPPVAVLAAVRPGQTMRLRAHVGPVVVERAVEVVRPSAGGRPLFVKAADGKVFAAPAPILEPVS